MARPPKSARPALDITDAATWPEFMTAEEVAEVLRISGIAARALIRNGEIAGQKVGTAYRVPKSSLMAFMHAPPAPGEEDPPPARADPGGEGEDAG